MNPQIPKGIEILVKKASVDPAFRAMLLERRAAAAGEIGLELDAAETMMLSAVPAAQLEAIIARTDVPQEHRRAFLGQAAAAMLAAVGALASTSSALGGDFEKMKGPFAGGGIRPDEKSPMRASPLKPGPKPRFLPREQAKPQPKPKRPGTIEERVTDLVAEQFKADKDTLTHETSVLEDLNASPSAQFKLKKELEKEFDLKISSETFKELKSLGKIIDHVEKLQKLQAGDDQADRPASGKSP